MAPVDISQTTVRARILVLAGVTNDVNAPPSFRADAYAMRMRVLADLDDWPRATHVWHQWHAA